MDTNNEEQLKLDPSVMVNKDETQNVESIDQKYGVELFTEKDADYNLYAYDTVNQQLYTGNDQYTIDLDTDQLASYFTEPVVYPVDVSTSVIDYTNLLIGIMFIQLLVVIYFVVKIIKVKGKNEKSYN